MTGVANPPCARCGGPHPFDVSVPSAVWNDVIRARHLPEYLCLTCIVEAFACFGESFTATLWGGPFQGGLPIEVRIRGDVATDAAKVSEENTALRARIRELYEVITKLGEAAPTADGWLPITSAPTKDKRVVLLYGCQHHRRIWGRGYYFKGVPGDGEGWIADVFYTEPDDDMRGSFTPTHWMPLPPAPPGTTS